MKQNIVVLRPRVPKVTVLRLLEVARRAVHRAVAAHDLGGWLALRGVFVAVDAGRSPGRELAVFVTAAHEGVSEHEARRLVEDRVERRRPMGISFIFTAFVEVETLFSFVTLPEARKSLRRWLATPAPPRRHRLVALSGSRLALELAPAAGEETTSRSLDRERAEERRGPAAPRALVTRDGSGRSRKWT